MDETTGALEAPTEEALNEAISNLAGGKQLSSL
jgi:hypothetical protein